MTHEKPIPYHFFPHDAEKLARSLGREKLLSVLKSMLLIRNFEIRAESAYQQGKVGGFFHSYMGQEAIAYCCLHRHGQGSVVVGLIPLPRTSTTARRFA